jgi:iron complex transport system substrate-binding protein
MVTLLLLVLTVHIEAQASSLQGYRRIVSLGPLITKNLYLLGAGERLVGDTIYCNQPRAAADKAKVGSVMEVSVERVVALHPDLVLATGLTRAEQVKALQSLGLHVVCFKTPRSFEQMCAQFIELGVLLDQEARARDQVAHCRSQVERVASRVRGLPRSRVLLQVGTQPIFAAIGNTFPHELIELGGGSNILANQSSGRVGIEQVMVGDPEVILIAIMGSEYGSGAKLRQQWFRFPTISAVRQGRVHVVDPELFCSPSPADFILALDIAASLIHPEQLLTTME